MNVAFKDSREEITSSAADNHKVCLAVANGDEKLAEGLFRYVYPRLTKSARFVDGVGDWDHYDRCSKRAKNAIGAPSERMKS